MKKILSIVMILVTVLALMVPAFASAEEYSGVDMWVNCDNGKTLNVREEPRTGSRVITRLECGTKVHVDYFTGDGWAAISDYHFSGYVQAKFLVSEKPGKYEITEREDDFVAVKEPYLVSALARSAKSDSSVGLRVCPRQGLEQGCGPADRQNRLCGQRLYPEDLRQEDKDMNSNRRELTMEELEQVNGAGFWDLLKEIGEMILEGMTGADN